MKTKNILLILILITPISLLCQNGEDTTGIFYKKSLSFRFNGLTTEGGLGGSFWFNSNYSTVILINAHYWYSVGYRYPGTEVTYLEAEIYPLVSIRRHIFAKENITPYFGATIQPSWYVGDYRKYTVLSSGVIIGVESWLTESITITGEQGFYWSKILNENSKIDRYGNAAFSISFYF